MRDSAQYKNSKRLIQLALIGWMLMASWRRVLRPTTIEGGWILPDG